MHGVIVIDKPAGMTSASVVARIKRALGAKRVGHTGTLDPMATGVLPICIGEGTKLAGYLLAADKAYEAELALGIETDTLDADGEVTARNADAAARVIEAQVERAIDDLRGEIDQVPPAYSAIKQSGKRAYQRARAGEQVDLPPRRVTIHRLALRRCAPPMLTLFVECSKGTYIRSLARDLGRALACGAHLTALRRVRSGAFGLDQAIPLAEISPERAAAGLIAPPDAVAHLPAAVVPADRVAAVRNGQKLPWEWLSAENVEGSSVVRLLTPGGALLALARPEAGRISYARVFTYGLTDAAR